MKTKLISLILVIIFISVFILYPKKTQASETTYNINISIPFVNTTIYNCIGLWNWCVSNPYFNISFKNDPSTAETVKFEREGYYVAYQPLSLNFRNALNMIQQISTIKFNYTTVEGSTITYYDAFGSNIDLMYKINTEGLKEYLVIVTNESIPKIEQYILDGGNVTIDLDFLFDYPKELDVYVNNTLWDKKTTMKTKEQIDFKDSSGKTIFWLPKPYARASTYQIYSTYELKKSGTKLYITIKTPINTSGNYSVMQFPAYIDPSTTYNFTQYTTLGHKAYDKGDAAPTNPWNYLEEATTSEYQAISSSDNAYWQTAHADVDSEYNSQIYHFNISESATSVKRIDIAWEGYTDNNQTGYDLSAFIWNATGSAWVQTGSLADGSASDTWFNATYWYPTNLTHFINVSDSNNWIYSYARHKHYVSGGGSCPTVFGWNGTDYDFESEVISRSFTTALEEWSYARMENIKPTNNSYKFKIVENKLETDYFNQMNLWVIDHLSKEILPDYSGNIHTIDEPLLPMKCVDNLGRDCLESISKADYKFWDAKVEINPEKTKFSDFRPYMEITLPKTDSKKGKLILHIETFAQAEGNYMNLQQPMSHYVPFYSLMNCLESFMPDWLLKPIWYFGIEHIEPKIFYWNGNDWALLETIKAYTYIGVRKVVYELPMDKIVDNKIKIESLARYWMFDYVAVDYTEDKPLLITKLDSGIKALEKVDDDYLIVKTEDIVDVEFPEVKEREGWSRSYVMATEGSILLSDFYNPSCDLESTADAITNMMTGSYYSHYIYLKDFEGFWQSMDKEKIAEYANPDINKQTLYTDYVQIKITTIPDTTLPTFSGNTTNETIAGYPCEFKLEWNDDLQLHSNGTASGGYIFSTNNSGTWVNSSLTNFTATPQNAINVTTLNSTVGTVVSWRFYANDTYNGTLVASSIYSLTVTQPCLTITSSGTTELVGSIINAPNTVCINISANDVILDCKGYTIDGLDTSNTYGIYAYRSSATNTNITIRNCTVTDWYYGIYLENANNNTIINGTVNSNALYGIDFNSSSNNTITNITANSNTHTGMWFSSSHNNTLTNNILNSNSQYGIVFNPGNNNTLTNNTANSNTYCGIYTSGNNTILTNNTVNSNSNIGIQLLYGNNNTLTNNTANSNYNYNIYLYQSHNNTLTNNIAKSCTNDWSCYNVLLEYSSNNTLTDNFIGDNPNGNGIRIYGSTDYPAQYNNITGGSIYNNTYDYTFGGISAGQSAGSTNIFTNTNFTSLRAIRYYENESWFNYRNDTTSLQLSTNLNKSGFLKRALNSWTQTNISWDEYWPGAPTGYANYTLYGLIANNNYTVYNFSVLAYTLNASSCGCINFTIDLNSTSRTIQVNTTVAGGQIYPRNVSQSFSLTQTIDKKSIYLKQQIESFILYQPILRLQSLIKSASQSFSPSVITSRIYSAFKSLSQQFSLSDIAQRFFIILKSISGSFQLTTIVARLASFIRINSETLNVNFALTRLSSIYRSIATTFTVNQVSARILIAYRSVTSFFTTNLLATRLYSSLRYISDYFTMSLAIIRTSSFLRSLSQLFTTNLITSRIYTSLTSISQLLGLDTAFSRTIEFYRTLSESLSTNIVTERFLTLLRSMTDYFTISQISSRLSSIYRSMSDYFTTNLAISRTGLFLKSISDSITTNIVTVRIQQLIKSIYDTFNIETTIMRSLSLIRITTQSFTTNIITSKLMMFSRVLTQPFDIIVISSRLQVISKSLIQYFTTNIVASRMTTLLRSLSESFSINAIASSLTGFYRSITGSFIVTDSASRIQGLVRTLTETFSTNIITTRLTSIFKSLSDTFTISSTITKGLSYLRSVTDSLVINTISSTISSFLRSLSQFFTTNLAITRLSSIYRSVTGYFSVSAVSLRIQSLITSLSQYLSINVMTARVVGFSRTITSSFIVNQATSRIQSLIKLLSESFSISSISSRFSIFLKATTTGFSITDTIDRISQFFRILSQNILINQLLIRTQSLTRAFTQQISLIGTATGLRTLTTRITTLSITITDTFNRTLFLTRTFTQSLNINIYVNRVRLVIRTVYQMFSISTIVSWLQQVICSLLTPFGESTCTTAGCYYCSGACQATTCPAPPGGGGWIFPPTPILEEVILDTDIHIETDQVLPGDKVYATITVLKVKGPAGPTNVNLSYWAKDPNGNIVSLKTTVFALETLKKDIYFLTLPSTAMIGIYNFEVWAQYNDFIDTASATFEVVPTLPSILVNIKTIDVPLMVKDQPESIRVVLENIYENPLNVTTTLFLPEGFEPRNIILEKTIQAYSGEIYEFNFTPRVSGIFTGFVSVEYDDRKIIRDFSINVFSPVMFYELLLNYWWLIALLIVLIILFIIYKKFKRKEKVKYVYKREEIGKEYRESQIENI